MGGPTFARAVRFPCLCSGVRGLVRGIEIRRGRVVLGCWVASRVVGGLARSVVDREFRPSDFPLKWGRGGCLAVGAENRTNMSCLWVGGGGGVSGAGCASCGPGGGVVALVAAAVSLGLVAPPVALAAALWCWWRRRRLWVWSRLLWP